MSQSEVAVRSDGRAAFTPALHETAIGGLRTIARIMTIAQALTGEFA